MNDQLFLIARAVGRNILLCARYVRVSSDSQGTRLAIQLPQANGVQSMVPRLEFAAQLRRGANKTATLLINRSFRNAHTELRVDQRTSGPSYPMSRWGRMRRCGSQFARDLTQPHVFARTHVPHAYDRTRLCSRIVYSDRGTSRP